MKKILVVTLLSIVTSNFASATMLCSDLFDSTTVIRESKSKVLNEKTFTIVKQQIDSILSDTNFSSVLTNNVKPTWEQYNQIVLLMETLPSGKIKLTSEKIKNLDLKKAEYIESLLSEKLKDATFEANYKAHLDAHYEYFKLLEKINKQLGYKVFPEAKFDLVPTNEQVTIQGEQLLNRMNSKFEEHFSDTGYKDYEAYTKHVREYDAYSKQALELVENNLMVAMHRPESARFWVPITGLQNQRVTGSSKGYLGADARNRCESNLIQTPIAEYLQQSVRFMPKYAEAIPNEHNRSLKFVSNAGQYGSDLWIIKKDVIEKRSTWTPADSLGPGWGENFSQYSKPINQFIPWKYKNLVSPYLRAYMKNNMFGLTGIDDGTHFKSEVWRRGSSYMEVQIFGELNINHIEAFHFKGNPPDKKFADLLKSKNIKIFDARGEFPVEYEVP